MSGVDVTQIGSDGKPIPPVTSGVETLIGKDQQVGLSRISSPVSLDLARKLTEGQRAFFFFGFNDDVDAGWEDIHSQGGDINWLTAANQVEVLSSDVADTAAGLGVRSVEIHGLDEQGNDQDEVIAMNGTSVVLSVKNYCRINSMHNEKVGTYGGSHKGDVTCQVASGGAVLAVMTGREGNVDTSVQYGSGESGLGYYSVPLGKVLYIRSLTMTPNVKTNQTVDVILYEREGILNSSAAPFDPRRILWSAIEVAEQVLHVFDSHIKIKQLTDIWFRAQGSGTNNKIAVSLDFYLLDQNSEGE